MATIDFTTPTASGGCGCSNPADAANVAAAVTRWRTFALNPANQPPTLTIAYNPTTYDCTSNTEFFTGIRNPTVTGTGGVPKLLGLINVGTHQTPTYSRLSCSGFIDTCFPGQTSVTLLNPGADAAKFVVGDFVLIGGLELMGGDTDPANLQFFEYNQITGKSGATISLQSPLKNKYVKTWPMTHPKAEAGAICSGPAAICAMDQNTTWGVRSGLWNHTTTLNNLKFTSLGSYPNTFGISGGRYFNFNNVTWDGDVHSVGQCERCVLTNCTQLLNPAHGMEFDKLVDYFEANGCNMNGMTIQSKGANTIKIINGTYGRAGVSGGLQVAGNDMIITGSHINNFFQFSPGFFGYAEKLTVGNTVFNFTTGKVAWHGFGSKPAAGSGLAGYTYMGNGVFGVLKSDSGTRQDLYAAAVPGREYVVAYAAPGGDPIYVRDDGGNITRFCVTDVYDDATYAYIKTTLMAKPTNTFAGGNGANFWFCIPLAPGGFIDLGGNSGTSISSITADNISPAASQTCAFLPVQAGGVMINVVGAFVGIAGLRGWIADRVLDYGLNILDTEVDKIYICSRQPTTYAEATTSGNYALGSKTFGIGGAFAAPADATPSGHKTSSTSFSDGSLSAAGTAAYWAAVDSANSRLLATGPLGVKVGVPSSGAFGLSSFDVTEVLGVS
jgi:hypothetical protein